MPDVALYCVSGEIIKNNSSVCAVSMGGDKQSKQHGFNEVVSHSGLESNLDLRMDDTTYYTA